MDAELITVFLEPLVKCSQADYRLLYIKWRFITQKRLPGETLRAEAGAAAANTGATLFDFFSAKLIPSQSRCLADQ